LNSVNIATLQSRPGDSGQSLNYLTRSFLGKVIDEYFSCPEIHSKVENDLFHYLQDENRNTLFDTFPALFFVANEKNSQSIFPIIAAWQVVRIAAKILDDIEDGDLTVDIPSNLNLSTIYLQLSEILLDHIQRHGVSLKRADRIRSRFSEACLVSCIGQHKDLRNQNSDIFCFPSQCIEIAREKSAALFAWACWAGAVAGGLSEKNASRCWNFGFNLGVLVQIADDYRDVWNKKSSTGQVNTTSLPFCYAYQNGDDTVKQALSDARKQGGNVSVSLERTIVQLGTQKYIVSLALEYYHEGKKYLDAVSLPEEQRQSARHVLDGIFPALTQFT
jgi:geranylgeranyl pyrophosphate synthase